MTNTITICLDSSATELAARDDVAAKEHARVEAETADYQAWVDATNQRDDDTIWGDQHTTGYGYRR